MSPEGQTVILEGQHSAECGYEMVLQATQGATFDYNIGVVYCRLQDTRQKCPVWRSCSHMHTVELQLAAAVPQAGRGLVACVHGRGTDV